jgi:hypothetical protein
VVPSTAARTASRESRPAYIEGLVEQIGAFLVIHAERRELAFEIADSDGQREPAAGQ